ncbi:hypothetical protein B0H19DRAFT_1056204 [Mycena capillaripes]|nr:hypothetical protein B0H19DRAFT_1056204 [Mycena capillaripes]
MPPGRKPLDPHLRLQHRQESLQRYAEKNANALRAAARLRMQRKRAEISAGDYKTRARYAKKAREASEKYRFKKAEEERAADVARRLLRKKVSLKPKTKPQHCGESRSAPQATTGSKSKSRAHREARPTPLRTAATKLKRHEGHVHRHEQNKEDSFSDDSGEERRRRRRSESPIFPGRIKPRTVVPPPCSECGEVGCPGCACMCMESTVWIEHKDGHFFPTCAKCGGDDCPGIFESKSARDLFPSLISTSIMSSTNAAVAVPKALLCTPVFSPDPGHEDTERHSKASEEWFYGVITKNWQGIVTSKEAVDRMKAKDATAHIFKASTWGRIHELWRVDCAEHHAHGEPAPLVVDIATDSTPSRPASRVPSPTKASRRTPSPTKAGASTSKKVGVQFCIPPFHTANHHPPCQLANFDPFDALHDTAAIAAKFETWSSSKDDQQPLMFAVSGTSRIFRDRYRALAAFLETPGAELFYTYDEDAVLDFIEKEATRMLKKKEKA